MIFHSYVSLPEGNSNIQTDTWGFHQQKWDFHQHLDFDKQKLEKHKRRPGFHQPESGEFSGPSVSGAVSPALSNPLAVKLLDSYVMLHVYLYLQYL